MRVSHSLFLVKTALAASVDLRCYGLTSPRYDGQVSVNFSDLGSFFYEWEIDKLPWDAVTPVPAGASHPDALDTALMEAIDKHALPAASEENSKARNAAWTFLYLYLILATQDSRYALQSHVAQPH